jgi:hypothetical protein
MTRTVLSLPLLLLFAIGDAPAYAANCRDVIERVQAEVDAAIDRRAGADPSHRESLDALRSHQPTPRSIAEAEGAGSAPLSHALDALGRARAAAAAGDTPRCEAEVSAAQRLLASPQ